MTLSILFSFCLTVLLLLITPGPGVLSTAGLGAAFGFRAGLRYVTGLWLGTNLVAIIVVSGFAAAAMAIPWTRYTLLTISTCYLSYIAFRIALARSRIAFITSKKQPGVIAGLLLQFVNPKAYAVNTIWFTGFAFYTESLLIETLLKFLIINAVWIPIHLIWLAAGNLVQQLNLPARTQFRINIAMALALLTVVFLALGSAFYNDF